MPTTRASKLGCSAVLTAVCWISGPAQAALVTDLSHHWKLDDTSGSTAVAATGGVNGTIQSFPPSKVVTIDQPGQVNKAFVFSGGTFGGGAETNPGVLLAAGMLPATGQFTVSAWIKTNGAGTSLNGSIFANRTSGVANSFGLDINVDGKLRVLAGGAVPETEHLTSPAAVNTGDWVHVAASRNGSNLVGLYVNGQVVNTVTGTESIDQENLFYIGNRNGRVTPFDGSIDDVATWTRALTGQELALLGGLGYFAGVGVSDGTQIDNLLGVYNAQSGTATVGGQTWTYASGLGLTTVGARGGSVEEEDAFIVLGSDGTGVVIVPEPGAIMLAGLGLAALAGRFRRWPPSRGSGRRCRPIAAPTTSRSRPTRPSAATARPTTSTATRSATRSTPTKTRSAPTP
jgi:hypothetical protein